MVGQLTAAGSVLGTASYISPEQASGAGATPLSDVYALGVVAYQCLSGVRPFEGENPLEIAMRHVRDAPPPLPADIPPIVRQVVAPAARWPTAAALGQVARQTAGQLSGGTGTAVPSSGGPTGMSMPVSPGFSGPPGSPVAMPGSPVVPRMSPAFGSPVSGPPTSSAGGTRIMPGAVPAGYGATGAQPGHAARGAAGVPPPPPRGDTSYMDLGNFPPGPPLPGPQSGGSGGSGKRGGLLPVFIVLGVIVALLLVGGIVYALQSGGGKPGANTTPTAGTGGQPTPTASVRSHNIDCTIMKRLSEATAKRQLENANFKVVEVPVSGDIPGRITDVSPCGRQPEGTTITLKVVKNFDGSLPGNGGTPSAGASTDNGNGGGNDQPSTGATTGATCGPGEIRVGNSCQPVIPSQVP
jgi:serine/threonine-protein kinase